MSTQSHVGSALKASLLFVGIYLVPMAITAAVGVRGIAVLVVSHAATAVQIGVIVYFFYRKNRYAGIVGIIVTGLIVVINNAGTWMIK